jgi:F-type H+-transporting ATPase subunit epsilon
MSSELFLEIITPSRLFFSGEVEIIVFETPEGQIGILKNHSPVVCHVIAGEIRIKQNERWMSAAVTDGFIEVIDNEARIFADTAEWPNEIDVNRALAAKQRAEERLQSQLSRQEYLRSQAALSRALARLKVKKTLN